MTLFDTIEEAFRSLTNFVRTDVASRAHATKKKKHVALKKKKKPAPACTVQKQPPKKKPKKGKKPAKTTRADGVRATKATKKAKPKPCEPVKHHGATATAASASTPSSSKSGSSSSTPTTPTPPTPPPPSQVPWPPYSGPPVFAPLGSVGGETGWLNVMSYGAQGNGSADDTAALNAACNAARQINVDGGVAGVYLPAGVYNISSTINVFNVFLRGDGMGATKIKATSDWAGSPNGSWALDQQPGGASGTAPETGTWIEDLWLSGPGTITPGSVPCKLSGVRVGMGAGHRRVRIDGFFAGSFLFSSDERIEGPGFQGSNYYGIYYGGPSPATGDQVIADVDLRGAAWASIGIASGASLQNASLRSVSLGSAPFGIYKEEAQSGDVTLSGCLLTGVHFDTCGNGNIFVNGPAGGGGDIQDCVFQGAQSSGALSSSTAIALSTNDARGRAIGRTLGPIDLLGGSWTGNEVQAADPAYLGAGNSSYSALIACASFTAGRYGPATTAIGQAAQDSKRFTTGACSGDAVLMDVGTSCRLMPATGSAIKTSDVVEAPSGPQAGVQQSTGTRRTLGVAMHPANSGDSVPVAYSGIVTINCGTNTIAPDDPLKADPTQAGCVVTTTLTDPTVFAVAQQASSNGTVQAFLQSL